jgi:hypothetical protein
MNTPLILIEALGLLLTVAAVAGGITAYYRKSAGSDALVIAQKTIALLNDENTLLTRKVNYLENQVTIKDETIERIIRGKNFARKEK